MRLLLEINDTISLYPSTLVRISLRFARYLIFLRQTIRAVRTLYA